MTKRNLALSLSFTLSLLLLGSFLLFMLDINTSHALAQSALVPSALATTALLALGAVQPISGLTSAGVTAAGAVRFANAPIGNLTDA